MSDVHTRDGIFGPGGYGGGVFDGSNMGFGGLGEESHYEQAAAGISGLTSPTQWTIGPNEWPSTVSQAVVKSTTRWKELLSANPNMKLVTVNGQPNLTPWKVGQVVNLPTSWGATSGGGVTIAAKAISADDVAFLVSVVNNMLYDMGFAPISGAITQVNPALCGAADFVAKQVEAKNQLLNAQDVADFMGLAQQLGAVMGTLCQPLAPWPAPAKSAAPPPASAPQQQPTAPSVNPCLVTFGSSGPAVIEMQKTMNIVLTKNGYTPIPVSGIWDAATCGAMFALEGEWDPVITSCPGGWQVPPGCPKGVTPVKPVKTDETTTSKASMAWVMGGLLGAAAIAGVYASRRHR